VLASPTDLPAAVTLTESPVAVASVAAVIAASFRIWSLPSPRGCRRLPPSMCSWYPPSKGHGDPRDARPVDFDVRVTLTAPLFSMTLGCRGRRDRRSWPVGHAAAARSVADLVDADQRSRWHWTSLRQRASPPTPTLIPTATEAASWTAIGLNADRGRRSKTSSRPLPASMPMAVVSAVVFAWRAGAERDNRAPR